MRIPFASYNIVLPRFVVRHKWKFIVAAIIFFVFVLPVFLLTRPKAPEYVTAEAKRQNLMQTVEAVGEVTSEKDLELQFRSAGIVSDVAVKEGDHVRAGQRLASLRAGGFAASIASAQASVAESEAQLRALLEGTRPEDLAVAEASLANKKAALEAAKQALVSAQDNVVSSETRLKSLNDEADITKSGDVALVPSLLSQKMTTFDQAVSTVQDILRSTDLQDAISRGSPGDANGVQIALANAGTSVSSSMITSGVIDVPSAVSALQNGRTAGQQAASAIDRAFALVSNVAETSNFTVSQKSTYKTSINTQRTYAQSALRDLENELQSLQQTPASLQTRISTEESNLSSAKGAQQKAKSDILTYETAVRIEQAQYDLKRAGARQTDIDAAQARVNIARASLARAAADYGDTLITAPVDGIVTRVAIKAGEFTPTGAAVTMMGDSPYRIEMYVSEIDVPKLAKSQSGSITLDAFRRTPFALRVAEIDARATDNDGVPKYRVKLDFVTPPEGLRIGMTGDAEIITGRKDDVVSVPRRAVLDAADGSGSVVRIFKNGSALEQPVSMGMEGGDGNVEILSGLSGGETVVVLQK